MAWLWEKQVRHSEKNGEIVITRQFGRWKVIVDGCTQTSEDYTPAMWADALTHIDQIISPQVQSVLLLGLAAGSSLRSIHNRFPNSVVTAVEYDSEMVCIAKELGLYKPSPFPTVLLGDAGPVVGQIRERFDLVLVDLFTGFEPSPLITDSQFLTNITQLLTSRGVIVANLLARKDYAVTAGTFFIHSKSWKFSGNTLAAFWNHE